MLARVDVGEWHSRLMVLECGWRRRGEDSLSTALTTQIDVKECKFDNAADLAP